MIKNFSNWLTESVGNSQVDSAMSLITKYLTKKLSTEFIRIPGVEQYKNSSDAGYGIRFFFGKKSIRFNWATASMTGMNLKSIDLWDGTSHDPNWHVEFESAVSLVKIIPNIVDIIKSPKAGTFLSVPEENLNEELIVEATQLNYEDSYAEIVKLIASNTSAIPRAEITNRCGWRGDTLTKWMFDNLPQYFEKDGRAWKWKTQSGGGSVQSTLNGLKDKIFAGVGAVKTTVSRGGSGETYAPTKSEESIDVEKIAFETQLEHLKDLIKLIVKGASNALFVAGKGGTGKALPNDAPVLTPEGWVRIADLKVGDNVLTQDGSISNIVGVYPQGIRNTMTVTFKDGRNVECDEDHLWEVNYYKWKESRVLSTIDIKNLRESKKWDSLFTIPLFNPSETPDIDLPVDPYLLGVLLGDGSFRNGTIQITSADSYIIERVSSLIPESTHMVKDSDIDYRISKNEKSSLRNDLTTKIRELGLFGHLSSDKFIPEVYKNASKSQKLAIIQGLIDTDAWVGEGGEVVFTSTSEKLANDLAELVYSIGGKSKIVKSDSSYVDKNGIRIKCKPAYNVSIRYPKMRSLTTLPRKLERIKETDQYSHVQLPIVRIESTGESKECTCIKIDSPRGLFVTTNYVVTHNTQTTEDTLSELGKTDGNGYFKVTGTSSAVGLFELLFRNRDSLLLFDDADGVVADQDARNLLKAATDTKKVRKIVWNKASKRFIDPDNYSDEMEESDYLPKYFEFTGRVIFISNLKIDKLDPDGALRTRALMIDIDPTDAELVDYMEKIVDNIRLEEGQQLGHNARMEVVELLKAGGGKRKDVSLRKLVRGLNVRAALGNNSNWKEIVSLYA